MNKKIVVEKNDFNLENLCQVKDPINFVEDVNNFFNKRKRYQIMRENDGLYEVVDEKSSLKYIEIGTDYMALVIKFKDTKSKKIEKAFFWKIENISYKFIDDHILHLTDYRPNEKRICTTVTYRVKDSR